jgi:hypothetical protein
MSRTSIQQELSFAEVVQKYTDVPRLIALKIDAQRRGVHYTTSALEHVDESRDQMRGKCLFGSRDAALANVPESLILRDGTTILTDQTPLEKNPYLVDWSGGRFVLRSDEFEEEVDLWPRPAYYGKHTSRGTPMEHVMTVRPQRLNLCVSGFCHFWTDKKGCQFCDIVENLKQQKAEWGVPTYLHPEDVEETLREALREPGRFTNICLTGGSDMHGEAPFDKEVDRYVEILQHIGRVFEPRKFPSQLIATAFTENQLMRLWEETGLTSYTSDIEVLNERLFDWICPGKAKWVGYREWKRRLIAAVDIFGRGNVGTGVVAGVEMARAHGFASEDEALKATLEEAEDLAVNGVTTVYMVWVPRPGSSFRDQSSPSLEYYVRLAKGLHDLRVKYALRVDFDDYRRCGNHPDSDLSRLLD